MEPMLLEDYTVERLPRSIKNVLDYFKKEKIEPNECDIFVGFLYILMLESGYVRVEDQTFENDPFDFNYRRVLTLSKELPKGMKRDNNDYHLSFVLPQCPLHVCQMICVSANEDFLINCWIRGIEDGKFSLMLDPKIYVPNTKFFCNLRGLSTIFKSNISYKVKCSILSLSDFRFNHICVLPCEVLGKITSYLDCEDLLRVRLVCKHLNVVVDVWKLKGHFREKRRIAEVLERRLQRERRRNRQGLGPFIAAVSLPPVRRGHFVAGTIQRGYVSAQIPFIA